jgi:hypothetical protein
MTSYTTFDAILVKVERAKEHVHALQRELHSFFVSNPYMVAMKVDPVTQRLIYYLADVADPPAKLSTIVGDAIHNLRTALDHLAYELVALGSGQEPSTRIYFPICEDSISYRNQSPAKTKGMHAIAKRAIDETKPYRLGNDILWQIHKLDIIDKHRMLMTVGSTFASVNISAVLTQHLADTLSKVPGYSPLQPPKLPDLFLNPAERIFPLQPGTELFIDAVGAKPNSEIKFKFEVLLYEDGIVEGQPLVETLQRMIKVVEDLIVSFKPLLI